MSTDTPIFDETAREIVCGLAPSFFISDRYTKAVAFRDYLKAQWLLSNINVNYFGFTTLLNGQTSSLLTVSNHIGNRSAHQR